MIPAEELATLKQQYVASYEQQLSDPQALAQVTVLQKLRPFKPGAFELASSTRTPILPIAIVGTADALPKRGFVLQGRHAIRIRVLDPIPYEQFADMPVDELAAHVRQLIADEVARTEPVWTVGERADTSRLTA